MDKSLEIDLNQGLDDIEVDEQIIAQDNGKRREENEQCFDVENLDIEREVVDENPTNIEEENLDEQEVVVNNLQIIDHHEDQEENEPKVGMCFPSGEEYAKFCHTYAYKKGFSFFTRTARLMDAYKHQGMKRTESGEKETAYHMMKQLRFACKKGGQKKTEGSSVTGCKVFVHGNMVDGKMEIRCCELQHNHSLHPDSSRLMVNYRSIDEPNFDRIVNNDRAGISIVKNFNAFLVENGGHDNLTFNQRDMRNAVNLERRKTRFQGDAIALEEYFVKQQHLNDKFYSSIQRDCDGRLMNVFWSDARCRAMCEDFGDIITFDTTFQTNRYEMPLAPFVGVNHHGSSIIFACALISHEDTETFVWVFNEWLKCMGKAPLGILTDQDKAIGKAVRLVFPEVPHRLCLWHIMKNASKNLGSNKNWKQIEVALRTVVHDCVDPEEFDEAWAIMMDKFKIGDNSWIQESFELREKWSPGYCRDNFWAGMSSTQRSEGMNRFLKGSVCIDTPLGRFVQLYEAAMGDLANTEHKLNFASADSPLPVDKTILAEYVFHSKYTNAKFKEVRDEALGLRHTNILKTGALGTVSFYRADEKIPTPIYRKRWKRYNLTIDKEKGDFSCSCKCFEFRGILCKHIIRVIEVEDITFIPEKYILNRWRKDVIRRYEEIRVPYYDLDSERILKTREISLRNKYLSTLAMHTDDTFAMYKEATDKIRIELEALMGIERVDNEAYTWWDESTRRVFGRRRLRPKDQNERHLKKNVTPVEGGTKDPVDKRNTGRGKSNRTPNPSEKGSNKKKKLKYTAEEIEGNEVIIRETFSSLNGRWQVRDLNIEVSSSGRDAVPREAGSARIIDNNAMASVSQPSMSLDQSTSYWSIPSLPPRENPYMLRPRK